MPGRTRKMFENEQILQATRPTTFVWILFPCFVYFIILDVFSDFWSRCRRVCNNNNNKYLCFSSLPNFLAGILLPFYSYSSIPLISFSVYWILYELISGYSSNWYAASLFSILLGCIVGWWSVFSHQKKKKKTKTLWIVSRCRFALASTFGNRQHFSPMTQMWYSNREYDGANVVAAQESFLKNSML